MWWIYGLVTIILIIFYGIIVYHTTRHKNYEKRQIKADYYWLTVVNFSITIVLVMGLIVYRDHIFRSMTGWDIKQIIVYFLVIDFIYYWTHRVTHRIPYLRHILHETHHDVFDLLPLDFLNVSVLEYVMYILTTNLAPLLFLSVSMVEYFTIFGLILVHVIYCHSEVDSSFFLPLFIDSTYHRHHHQIGRGNYSVFFPIWDEYMKTRIQTQKAEPTPSTRLPSTEEKEKEKQEVASHEAHT